MSPTSRLRAGLRPARGRGVEVAGPGRRVREGEAALVGRVGERGDAVGDPGVVEGFAWCHLDGHGAALLDGDQPDVHGRGAHRRVVGVRLDSPDRVRGSTRRALVLVLTARLAVLGGLRPPRVRPPPDRSSVGLDSSVVVVSSSVVVVVSPVSSSSDRRRPRPATREDAERRHAPDPPPTTRQGRSCHGRDPTPALGRVLVAQALRSAHDRRPGCGSPDEVSLHIEAPADGSTTSSPTSPRWAA